MKNFLLFFVSLLLGTILAVGFQFARHTITHSALSKTPETHFSLAKAPSESLQGTIATFSGQVNWLSRTATQSVQLHYPQMVQQGEGLETKDNGRLLMVFEGAGTISLLRDTNVVFEQTLPSNLVTLQSQGIATYAQSGSKTPLSIRALDLLVNIKSGESTITVDPTQATITIAVLKGSATAAFNDTTNTSNVVPISVGQTLLFDNTTKTFTIENL